MINYSDNEIQTEAEQEAAAVGGNKREPAGNTNSPANAVTHSTTRT